VLPPLLVAGVGAVFGRTAAMRVLWPALLIYCALPVWAAINGALQSMTRIAVSWALDATQVPAYIEGNFVSIPSGTFEIAEGCSGLKYLVIATALSVFYAVGFLPTWRRRIGLIAVAMAAAIVSNWLRVYAVILVGHLSEMQHALVDDHRTFGWVLFMAFTAPVLWLAHRLEMRPVRNAVPEAEAEAEAEDVSGFVDARRVIAGVVVATLLLAGARIGIAAVERAGAEVRTGAQTPELTAAAFARPEHASAWQPLFVNAAEARAVLADVVPHVEIYLGAYAWQDQTHRLIAYGNAFIPADTWRPIGNGVVTVSLGDGALEVRELEGRLGGRRRLVWGWYWVAGSPATGSLEAKLLELKGLLSGRRDAAAVAVSTECEPDDCDAARARLAETIQGSMDHLRWQP
jgi:EpsI family protein